MTTPDYTNNTGTGIPIPSLLPSGLGQVASGIATGIAQAGEPDPIQVRRRWAVVVAINTDSTVDINLGGELVPHVSYDASYHPALDEVVQINVVDTDLTVIGPTANATYVSYIRRTGTIVNINYSGTAPRTPTSLSVTLSDAQVPQTILNVPFVSEFYPTVGDEVVLGQGMNTDVYLVLGAVNRTWRRPTGDIEPSLLTVAKPNTLLCQGQAVSRATYAALWAWAQLNGLVGAGLPFGAGDGSTTFTVPDFRGRVPVGAGTLSGVTWTVGTLAGVNSLTLTTAQMPSHDHNVTVADHATHSHSFTSGSGGDHSHTVSINNSAEHQHTFLTDVEPEHQHGFSTAGAGDHNHPMQAPRFTQIGGHTHFNNPGTVSEGADVGVAGDIFTRNAGSHVHTGTTAVASAHNHGGSTAVGGVHSHTGSATGVGGHTHTGTTGASGPTTHSVTESAVGGTTAVDVRQPSIGVNFLIWT